MAASFNAVILPLKFLFQAVSPSISMSNVQQTWWCSFTIILLVMYKVCGPHSLMSTKHINNFECSDLLYILLVIARRDVRTVNVYWTRLSGYPVDTYSVTAVSLRYRYVTKVTVIWRYQRTSSIPPRWMILSRLSIYVFVLFNFFWFGFTWVVTGSVKFSNIGIKDIVCPCHQAFFDNSILIRIEVQSCLLFTILRQDNSWCKWKKFKPSIFSDYILQRDCLRWFCEAAFSTEQVLYEVCIGTGIPIRTGCRCDNLACRVRDIPRWHPEL